MIATIREDLATDYQALANQHLEEVAQILEEYGATELEIGHQLQATEADRLATGQQTIETVELPDNPPEDVGPTPHEKPVAVTSTPPVSEPTRHPSASQHTRSSPRNKKPHQRNLHQSQNPQNPFKQTSLRKRKEQTLS